MKSKLIAISAISAGFVAIFLTVGAYVQMLDLFVLVVASVFVILPLHYNSYKASILTFLAGGVIAFLFSGFNILSVVFPAYFGFFGIYPIIKNLMAEKKLNAVVAKLIGFVWCVLAVFGIYFYYTLIMGEIFSGLPIWVENNIYIAVAFIAVIFYFVYDYSIYIFKKVIDRYLDRIIK